MAALRRSRWWILQLCGGAIVKSWERSRRSRSIERTSSKTKAGTHTKDKRKNLQRKLLFAWSLIVDSVLLGPCWWLLGRSLDGEFSSFAALRWLGPCSVHWIMIGCFAAVSLVDSWTVFGSVCLAGWGLAGGRWVAPSMVSSPALRRCHRQELGTVAAVSLVDSWTVFGSVCLAGLGLAPFIGS